MINFETASTKEFRKFEETLQLSRWTKKFNLPESMYYPVFAPISSKRKGDLWEEMYRTECSSLENKTDQWHDASLVEKLVKLMGLCGHKIEIKYTAITKGDSGDQIDVRGYALELGERCKLIDSKNPKKKQGGGSFQQVHPTNADYGLFTAVFGNGAVHYWVPYSLISSKAGKNNIEEGKIPLSSQHHGAVVEGQLNLTKRFHDLFFLDTTIGTPFITDLSKYDLRKYENLIF
jgi:hypothetical protein